MDADSQRRPVDSNALLLGMAIACFALWNIFALLTARCLYADGSHEFIQTLAAGHFTPLLWSRQFAEFIFQAPLVLAIKAGVTNLAALRIAFSLGCLLPWPVCLWLCYRIAPKHFWLALASCAAGYLNACFMAVGEHTLAHALALTCGFIILFARPLNCFTAAILLLGATGLVFSYESQLIFGPLLIFLALRRVFESQSKNLEQRRGGEGFWFWARRSGQSIPEVPTRRDDVRDNEAQEQKTRRLPPAECPPLWHHLILLTATILFAAGMIVAHDAILHPHPPNGFNGFQADLRKLLHHPGWTLGWTAIWTAIALLACVSDKFWRFLHHPLALILVAAAVMVWGGWPLLGGPYFPETHYHNRILNLAVPLAVLIIAAKIQSGWPWLTARRPRLIACTAVLLFAQSLWQLSATVRWHQDITLLQSILKTRDGIVLLHTTPIATCALEGNNQEFDWTWPSLSLAFTPDLRIHSLICSELYLLGQHHGWQPFDVLRPQTFPDLTRYHIDYTPYLDIYTNIVLPPQRRLGRAPHLNLGSHLSESVVKPTNQQQQN